MRHLEYWPGFLGRAPVTGGQTLVLEKARGGVFGFLVHTTDVANDLLQTNYVTTTIAGKMDPFKSAAQAEQQAQEGQDEA